MQSIRLAAVEWVALGFYERSGVLRADFELTGYKITRRFTQEEFDSHSAIAMDIGQTHEVDLNPVWRATRRPMARLQRW